MRNLSILRDGKTIIAASGKQHRQKAIKYLTTRIKKAKNLICFLRTSENPAVEKAEIFIIPYLEPILSACFFFMPINITLLKIAELVIDKYADARSSIDFSPGSLSTVAPILKLSLIIDISDLKSGMYFLKYKSKTKDNCIIKIVKE